MVGELLDDLVERGVDFSVPMLYVLDGSKALTKAVRKHAGSRALLQRCQLHKRRNVTAHLPEQYRGQVERKMVTAYQMTHYVDAKKALERLHRELMELNPSAARSLAEGMEETLTVHRLRIDGLLRLTLATTNPIESAFSVVDRICGRVKCWRRGDHRERWVSASLWLAERNFRRVKGYKQLPKITGGTRQAEHAASGSGRSGVNYNLRRAARFNGNPDILIGDVSKQHVLEVYNAPEFRRLRQHQATRQGIHPCETCSNL